MAFEVENLFQAVDIIIGQRLQDVSFDKTIICTIVDDSKKKNGCYVVTDGTIKFNAYVSDATYKNNDQVRVSVLGGDFGEKKFITGKYTGDEDSSPITYKSPLDSVIPITGNLVTETLHSRNGYNSLCANSDIVQQEIWRIDLTSSTSFRDLQANGIYNTLTIKADFKTALSEYDLIQGNYGLCLGLFIQPSFDSTTRIPKYITLDSSEMIGNPYSFLVYSTQAKKIDIVSTGVIAEMILWFYQSGSKVEGGSRFIERNGNEVPVKKDIDGNTIDNIFVKNIEIGFGSNIEKVSDNTLEIFTSSSPYYKYKDPTDATNKKDIELLWFNKTEENQFIGFSDGLFDLNYDEIEYLAKANQDARLIAQVGRTDIPSDESGLKLAADLKDAKPIMIKARDSLTRDLNEILTSLRRQVQSSNTILEELNKLLDTSDGILVDQWDAANQAIENWNAAYIGALQFAYDKQNNVENTSIWNTDWDTDYFQDYIEAINLALQSVNDFFDWLDGVTQPTAAQSAHRGNYDLYWYRASKKIAEIQTMLDQLDEMLKNNHTRLTAYKSGTYAFHEYKQKDFSAYANKYCIYWYRYDRNYKIEYNPEEGANNDEYNYGRFIADGWRRMDIVDGDKVLPNFGLPRDESLCVNDKGKPWYKEDGTPVNASAKKYYPPKALAQVVSRDMDINLLEEKYMVVLFYNHEMFKSNILTFTNSEPELIPSESLADQRDALKIEHDVASYEHYQVYDEYNQLRSLDDGGKIRQLKCSYDGLFQGDEALIDAGLYWYIPNHSTMLTFDKNFLVEEGFSTDADVEGGTEHSINGYTYFYKKIGVCAEADKPTNENGEKYDSSNVADRLFYYKIKPTLEKTATNNTILVKAQLKDMEHPVEGEITMTFSSFGTNGTKYTLTIVPATSQAAVIGKDNPLKLQVMLRDSKNEVIEIVDSNNVTTADAYGFKVESWNGLPNAFTVTNTFDSNTEPPDYIKGLTVSLTDENINNWNASNPYFGIINASVSFKQVQEFDQGITEEKNRVPEYQKYQVKNLNTLYAIPYSSSQAYYMSGATNIVYNNQGTVSFVSEDEYKLYTVNDKGNEPVAGQSWHIEYYDKNGNWIGPSSSDWGMLINYMPVLNSENRLTPAPLYIDGLDYVPVVICTVNGDYAWVQPIIITQNRYASSTLNDWNGSFTIDEANGTILATAVGAGKKEPDNSFSGVLMGDIGKGMNFDPDNISGLGLYGFNFGAQSFCLSVDGKAFFGKAGRGRIYIDGDHGTIASASYEQIRRNENIGTPAGMMIDLDDGFIHMRGTEKNIEDDGNVLYTPAATETGEGDNKLTAQAEILLTVGENDDYEITKADGTKETVDNTAYLKIRSSKQYDPNHHLIYVGSEKYYLQTDDYKSVLYSFEEGAEVDPTAAGTHLNLADGHFDAYNFKLSSKNIFINSANDEDHYLGEPYFVVRDIQEKDGKQIGVNLFYAGVDQYYLKSSDFTSINDETGQGKGIKINLKDYGGVPAGIEAYNFDLKAGQVAEDKSDYAIVLSDSGEPYLQINTAVTKENTTKIIPLVLISKTKQEFQSSDYSDPGEDTHGSGIKLSLSDKYLKAYSGFTLQAYYIKDNVTYPNYIRISSDSNSDPFYIFGDEYTYVTGKDENGNDINATGHKMFKVGWDGSITAEGGHFKNITAEGGTFSGNITATGTISGGTITGASIYAKYLYAGGGGGSKDSYILHATPNSVTINGATITAGGGGSGGGGGGGGGGASYGLDPQGNLKATNANLTSLTVRKQALFTDSCQTKIEGALGINTAPAEGYDMTADGNIFVGGNTEIEGNTEITGNTVINGTTKMTGFVAIGTSPTNYKLEVVGTTYLNGNVGIGTAPQDGSKLSVSGGIYLTGTGARLTIPSASSLYFNDITKTLPAYLEDYLTDGNYLTETDLDDYLTESEIKKLIESYGYTKLTLADVRSDINSRGYTVNNTDETVPAHKHTFYVRL